MLPTNPAHGRPYTEHRSWTRARKKVHRPCCLHEQVQSELWRFPDRTTAIGQMINAYLSSSVELNDQAVHQLFSANRWEKR